MISFQTRVSVLGCIQNQRISPVFCEKEALEHRSFTSVYNRLQTVCVVVWLNVNILISINVAELRQTQLVPGWGDRLLAGKPSHYVNSHPGRLSLLPYVGW